MADVATFKRNKIELTEYDCSKDILNRTLMATFTPTDVEVLEEILYSSIRIPLPVLEQSLSLSSSKLELILSKLLPTQLFEVKDDFVLVDKEMRKYYELQILKFEEDFKPGMEYLQGLLRKVPIHILPNWYSISRTSDNIFESIVEKYLHTPQIFQRYLMEMQLSDPIQRNILNELYNSPEYEIEAAGVIKKFGLTQEQFEEHMLYLEFSFAACIKFVQKGNSFIEIITPFYEWKKYLCHVRDTELNSIIDEEKIKRMKSSDFAVVEELTAMIELIRDDRLDQTALKKKCPEFDEAEFDYYIEKLCQLNLADQHNGKLVSTSDAAEWLKMDTTQRALFLYRHPLNTLENQNVPEELCTHRMIRDAEKSLTRVLNHGWVFLDEFSKGILIPLKDEHQITLTRQGRLWEYRLPEYTEDEKIFFEAVAEQWLLEAGITALGSKEGHTCLRLTPFGSNLFSNE